MYKLFVDTHSELITLAFVKENKVIKKEVESSNGHAEVLLPTFNDMLEENNINIEDIEEIIAVYGPGSFTGIRIGLSMVKILSYTKNIPVKLISSLEAYLISSTLLEDKISYIEDAKGAYVLAFNKENEVILEEQYLTDYEDLLKKYSVVDNKLDINKVIEYSTNLKVTKTHLIKANYIKKIEVEKW